MYYRDMEDEKKLDLRMQKERFLKLCRDNIHREGLEDLLDWLEKSDFFMAPASTRYHGAYEGGLCQHSLDVYDYAVKMNGLCDVKLSLESLTIGTLFHDLCKVNFYKLGWRSQKIDGVWEEVPVYTIEEQEVFGGHGAKSVFMVQRYMQLKIDEAAAINCHMGATEGGDSVRDTSKAYEAHKLAWVVHAADEASVYLISR